MLFTGKFAIYHKVVEKSAQIFGSIIKMPYLCTRFQEATTASEGNTNQDGDYSSVG